MKIRLHLEAEEGRGYSFQLWSQSQIESSDSFNEDQKHLLIESLASPARFNERFSPVLEAINYYDEASGQDVHLDVVRGGDGAPNNESLSAEVRKSRAASEALELTFSGSIDIEADNQALEALQENIDSIDYYPYFQSSDGTFMISSDEGYELVHNYNIPFTVEVLD